MLGCSRFARVLTPLALSLFLTLVVACGADGGLVDTKCTANIPECYPNFNPQDGDSTIDDRTDEEAPPFAQVPQSGDGSAASPTPAPSSTPPPSTSTGTGSGFGVDGLLSCTDFVAQYWKIGAKTIEVAPGPLLTQLKYTTTVTAVNGTQVTVRAQLETPDSSQNVDEQLTFDACTHGYMSAVPKTSTPCELKFLADETITVDGKSYNAKKYQIGECTLDSGKTFSSIVWRAKDLPLWGTIKREVRGTIVPSQLSGLIKATTKSWSFP